MCAHGGTIDKSKCIGNDTFGGTAIRNEERRSRTRNGDPERGTAIRNEERRSGTRNGDPERGTAIRNEERRSGTSGHHYKGFTLSLSDNTIKRTNVMVPSMSA